MNSRVEESANCRVDKVNQCEKLGFNKWGRGFKTQEKYKDITYHENGMQIYSPEDGLTVYQKRPFLTPEFYDQGCYEWYCPQKRLCPDGKLAGPTSQEDNMFKYYFASTDPYELNGGPQQCVGIKNSDINSYLGWEIPKGQQKPVWMINAKDKSTCEESNK